MLPYNAGFYKRVAGEQVCHGNCGPNLRKVGHLGCLHSAHSCPPEVVFNTYTPYAMNWSLDYTSRLTMLTGGLYPGSSSLFFFFFLHGKEPGYEAYFTTVLILE